MTPEQFAAQAPIHPDSLQDYRIWERLLGKWNARINLVAPDSLSDFWSRHALDSAQLIPHIGANCRTLVDFGSGAGFPGIALAIESKHSQAERQIHLIESVGKKASFLKTVSRETVLPTIVHSDRIEKIEPLSADTITARAFAPLHRLLPLAQRHLNDGGELLLLKGRGVGREISEVEASWSFDHEQFPSLSHDDGVILRIANLALR
ncbi:MAG: 16S rRNA (guanine(527)-N(7))-methyltransferase RsmG [Litorimonas sp.]